MKKEVKVKQERICFYCRTIIKKNCQAISWRYNKKTKWSHKSCNSACEIIFGNKTRDLVIKDYLKEIISNRNNFTPEIVAKKINKLDEDNKKFLLEIAEELDKLKKPWIPSLDEEMFYISASGHVQMTSLNWVSDSEISRMISKNNYFQNRRLAEKWNRIDKKIHKIAAEFPVVWGDSEERKCCFMWDAEMSGLNVFESYGNGYGMGIYGTGGFIKQAKNQIPEADLIFYFSKGVAW